MAGVYPLHFFEKRERNAELLTDLNERRDVFRKTRTAVSDTGVEKLAAYASVHSNSVRDFLHVRSARVADRGYGIDVGNFQGEERIRSVLD